MDREVGGFYPLPHYYHYYYFSSYVKTMFFEFIQGYFCVKKDIMMLCFNHGEYYVIIFQDEPLFLLTKYSIYFNYSCVVETQKPQALSILH